MLLSGEFYELYSLVLSHTLPSILVLDELDNLVATSSNDIQALFSLAATYPTMLRIMGIANTHTLSSTSSALPSLADVDRTASDVPSSKAAKTKTIHFTPYSASELLAILKKRFEELPQDELKKLLPAPTLTLLTKKISALTGDVRVLFEVLRGAIDIAIPSSSSASDVVAKTTVSPAHILSALKAHAPSPSNTKNKAGTASANTTGNGEAVAKVKALGLQQRLVLLATILALKRNTASLPLPLSRTASFTSITPPSTPTKRSRSPMKRSSSNVSTADVNAASTNGINSSQLFSYYSSLLAASDAFTPLSRSEFSDLLGILETTGLIALSTPSSSSLKRCSSFVGSVKANGASGVQNVSLQAHVREGELVRGLGISAEAPTGDEGDALEDGVRTIWSREMSQIRREARAKETLSKLEGFEGFEDAIEA